MPETINPQSYQEKPKVKQPDSKYVVATYLRRFETGAEELNAYTQICSDCSRIQLMRVSLTNPGNSSNTGFIFKQTPGSLEGLTIVEIERTCSIPEEKFIEPYELRVRVYAMGGTKRIPNPEAGQIVERRGLRRVE